jgi:hypothetical protein
MEFLNPTALYGLLALPLLVVPYLVRRKARRVIFSSSLLFKELGFPAAGRPWGRLRLPPIFFLQLLLLLLLILALSEPVFSVRPSKVAVVLDNSASMQTLEETKSRFALAQEQAISLISELGAAATVDVYLTVPRLEQFRTPALSPAQAVEAIRALAPYDLADPTTNYGALIEQLGSERDYDRVYFMTDHPAKGQTGALRIQTVGEPKGNLAVTSFQIARSSLLNSRLHAQVEVTNFSAKEERVKVAIKGGGSALSSRDLVVPAGRSSHALLESVPQHPYYEVEIATRDPLPLDNRRFALAPSGQNLRILAITPRPQSLASLRSIPGLNIDVISPRDYENADRAVYGLEIFHFSTPAALPQNPALFILPPNTNPLVELGNPISRTAISGWREPHTLTRYVNFALFRPSYARVLRSRAPGTVVLESPDGPLAIAAEQDGTRYLALGFDPFPYLGRENLPVSIFTLNFLDWFFEGGRAMSANTGDSLHFGPIQLGDQLSTPKGQAIRLNPGSKAVPETLYQGIYHFNRGGGKQYLAVNLQPSSESDLRDPTPIELAGASAGKESPSVFYSFWPYILSASFILLLVEWFVSASGQGSGLRSQASQFRSS